MGRKTNSVSLRLKKTNRDYNNCWYGDILYSENFSKSLKIGKYLSQTLKTIGLPIPQLSVVGAFKKANLLVCYLDPKKRQRLLEKSSKGFMQAPKALQTSRKVTTDSTAHGTKSSWPFSLSPAQKPILNSKPGFSFFSLGDKKQEESKALLKPLQSFLATDFSLTSSLQGKSGSSLKPASSTNPECEANVAFECEKEKKSHGLKVLQANYEQSINGDKHEKLSKAMEKSVLTVLSIKQNNDVSKKKQINYCYHGSIGLEFLQNKQLQNLRECKDVAAHSYNLHKQTNSAINSIRSLGSTTTLIATTSMELKGLKQENGKDSCFKSTSFSSLNNNIFFIKKQKQAISSDFLPLADQKAGVTNNLLCTESKPLWKNTALSFNDKQSDFSFYKKDKQEKKNQILGPKLYPYRFENTDKTDSFIKFKYFSDFFYNKNETSFLFLISAFSKNSKIFGKKIDLNYAFPFKSKPFRSQLVSSASNFNFNEKVYIDKKQFLKKEKISLTGLIGFYNGFSRFWENVVSLSFYRSTNETSCALFLADTVSYLLEKKVLFRSIKRQILLELNQSKFAFSGKETSLSIKKNQDKDKEPAIAPKFHAFALLSQATSIAFENKRKVTGIRISCKGRVGGRSKKAQRSRKDTLMWGETGLHVFSSKLDFAKTHAETPFGLVGVQVWVCTK